MLGILIKQVRHELSPDTLSLALGSDPNSHEVAPFVHFKEAGIPYDALSVSFSGDDYLICLGIPELFKDVGLFV
jgi:hypothetical protein